MITNQNSAELKALSDNMRGAVFKKADRYMRRTYVTTGCYHGDNLTDCIWIKRGLAGTFFFVSPCLHNARAESFIDMNGEIEYTLHTIERYDLRYASCGKVRVFGNVDDRMSDIMVKLANFWFNEQIKGTLAVTKDRGRIIRTTHGLMLCSEKELHKGVCLVNTFISDNELKGTQLEAVKLFDRHLYELAMMKYMEYFNGK